MWYVFNSCKVWYIFRLYDIENFHCPAWCSAAWLVLLHHSNGNEAVETEGFIPMFSCTTLVYQCAMIV